MSWLTRLFGGGRPAAPQESMAASVIDSPEFKAASAALNAALAAQADGHAAARGTYNAVITAALMKVGRLTLSADLLTAAEGLTFTTRRDPDDGSLTLELADD